VQDLQSQKNFRRIELHPISLFIRSTHLQIQLVLYHPEQILTRTVFEDKIDGISISECFLHPTEKLRRLPDLIRDTKLFEQQIDFLLIFEVFNAFRLVNRIFGYAFQRAQLVLVNHQFDRSELPRAYFHTRE